MLNFRNIKNIETINKTKTKTISLQNNISSIKTHVEMYLKTISIKKQILQNFKNIDNCVLGDNTKNTVLLIEPRFIKETLCLLANTYNKLGDNWNYVFYCGKSVRDFWQSKLPNFIEVRSLGIDNFENTKLYSDFCKSKKLWDSLYGEYVLTIQLDTWIMNLKPYDISYFINLNKSYIGGNMEYTWGYFDKIKLYHNFRNFNGGLSLRKRKDIIKIIEAFPPRKTLDIQRDFLTEHEDVYFTTGCVKLKLPIGDDEVSSHFSLHNKCRDTYFGIHQPSISIKKQLNKTNPFLKYLNGKLKL